ncbi:MAG TPA: 3-phosphoshikimate 1-carboxyvinyltransferase [Clostridiales bacterium]|nr:3-phosphoshikimate 1-carboxyvinyltransferase [Clostridiales bacterium]
MRVRIHAGRAAGEVCVPPSKSIAHRMLICAGLAHGVSVIRHAGDCEDILATLDCLSLLGADCRREGDTVTVRGGLLRTAPTEALPCRESGSTLRFLIPLALTADFPVVFTGYGRLPERPQTVYEEICAEQGLTWARKGQTVCVRGPLHGGDFRVAGNISSQFITGLLFALPTRHEPSRITLLPPVESRSYIDLTLDVLKKFGIRAEWETETSLAVPCGQRFTPCDCEAEGDWSAGAFWEALGRMGDNRVRVPNLNPHARQGDRICTAYLDALRKGPATLSLADCPDLGPMLFAYAAAMHGGTFTEVGRLRIKESDRIGAMREELAKCGAELADLGDTVTVKGGRLHAPKAPFDGHGDHRIVMALAVLATRTGGEIEGAEVVRKSYPAFWEDLGALGIRMEIL